MIAVILAAGKGSRLGAITNNLPKSLLPLSINQTILDFNINVLKKIGVKEIFIVTGFLSKMVEKHVSQPGIKFVFNPFWRNCNVLGSLYMALPYLYDDFLFLHADTLVDERVWDKLYNSKSSLVLPYKKKKCSDEEMKIRVDELGEIIEINKTMSNEEAVGEFLGICKFSKTLIPFISDVSQKLFDSGELNQYMEEVIQHAIGEKLNIEIFEIGNFPFVEVDFLEDYELAKKYFQ